MDDTPMTTEPIPSPTRAAGLVRLEAFLPRAGREYARTRNFDHGPANRGNVSGLSPWIRRRLVTEAELAGRVTGFHGPQAGEKFLQEVLWRTYWKGWMELRPAVWHEYVRALPGLRSGLGSAARRRLEAAEAGRTGIDGFDAWARELVGTGYLHNHARMWFASTWVFTLGLPWQLGADFFFRHLLDGDPAANTLSWRWVSGLHTRGKHYVARAANVRRYTLGRHDPAGALDETPPTPAFTPPPEAGRIEAIPAEPDEHGRSGLLVLGDDCSPELSPLGRNEIAAVASGWPSAMGCCWRLSPRVSAHGRGALADSLGRAADHWKVAARSLDEAGWTQSLLDWAADENLSRVVMMRPALGPWRETADQAAAALGRTGIGTAWVRRDWDSRLWPLARGGFFGFCKRARARVTGSAAPAGPV